MGSPSFPWASGRAGSAMPYPRQELQLLAACMGATGATTRVFETRRRAAAHFDLVAPRYAEPERFSAPDAGVHLGERRVASGRSIRRARRPDRASAEPLRFGLARATARARVRRGATSQHGTPRDELAVR